MTAAHQPIRDAIAAVIAQVPGAGMVHTRERFANRPSDFAALFTVAAAQEKKVCGWTIRRVGFEETDGAEGHWTRQTSEWEICFYLSFTDGDASELAFDGIVDAVAARFRNDNTLGGAVKATRRGGQTGLQLVAAGPVMFAGLLCHRARFRLFAETIARLDPPPADGTAITTPRVGMSPRIGPGNEPHYRDVL